jgi:hypothetical protein
MSALPQAAAQLSTKAGIVSGEANVPEGRLKGAILLLGSLYWEGNEVEQDGAKGRARKEWRTTHLLDGSIRDLAGLPIQYGRRSQSRNGQFTIVFAGEGSGVAKVAALAKGPPIGGNVGLEATMGVLKDEVIALAKAEEIFKDGENSRHWASWGVVAIAINPQSEHAELVREIWGKGLAPTAEFKPQDFGPGIVNQQAILEKALPWERDGLKGMDFCLLALTAPKGQLPKPEEIAKAIRLSSYFHRTNASGITTPDDEAIRKHLSKEAI